MAIPDQVMQGLEVAAHLMREGQTGEFHFPLGIRLRRTRGSGHIGSRLYMAMRYTVKLERVQRKPHAGK